MGKLGGVTVVLSPCNPEGVGGKIVGIFHFELGWGGRIVGILFAIFVQPNSVLV